MPKVAAVATALPPHRIDQTVARAFVTTHFRNGRPDIDRLAGVFDHAGTATRYICVPPAWFLEPRTFKEKNDLYIDWATRLGAQVARGCCTTAGIPLTDIDQVIFVSTTGLATPSIDARLVNVLGLRPDIRRTPIWGLGCAGGAGGLAHAYQATRNNPSVRVLLIAVELCSLTFQPDDHSKSNIVATALFADGAAGVLVVGDDVACPASCPAIADAHSTTWPDSLDVMGWNFQSEGMQVVFSRAIPALVRDKAHANITAFLKRSNLGFGDIAALAVHPGGTKVLQAYEETLELPSACFNHARAVLRDYGNMSSPTVLFVLKRLLETGPPPTGAHALMTALGPGFSAENLLLQF